jgi:ubiquinone biosynthesis monooxygenase Coq7
MRVHSRSDMLLGALDQGLRALAARPQAARLSPAADLMEPALADTERHLSGSLMRVNHAGEVAAQALYLGQAILARSEQTQQHLLAAAAEERDHLAWCDERLRALGDRQSLLSPLWFTGGFLVGLLAASLDDRYSLGFVAETERQVEAHLNDHLAQLPPADAPSRAVLSQMAIDESAHGAAAQRAGGKELPLPVRGAMSLGGEILRSLARWV